MSPSWTWSDKITNEREARVGYNHFISNKGKWNNCFGKFSNRVLPSIFISTILQSGKFLNLAHYFPYDVKLWLLAHSQSFLANQKARNAIVGAENLLNINILAWLRGFRVELPYSVLFSLYSSLFWELRDKKNFKNLQFWPESLGAMLEYWYIERGLFMPGAILCIGIWVT